MEEDTSPPPQLSAARHMACGTYDRERLEAIPKAVALVPRLHMIKASPQHNVYKLVKPMRHREQLGRQVFIRGHERKTCAKPVRFVSDRNVEFVCAEDSPLFATSESNAQAWTTEDSLEWIKLQDDSAEMSPNKNQYNLDNAGDMESSKKRLGRSETGDVLYESVVGYDDQCTEDSKCTLLPHETKHSPVFTRQIVRDNYNDNAPSTRELLSLELFEAGKSTFHTSSLY